MTRSDAEIKSWLDMKKKYESGKWKGHLPLSERLKVFDKRLNSYKASLILGRDFQESGDSFLNRKGLKKFWDWKP